MNTSTLVSLIVRETGVLVGMLASHSPVRPELARVSDEILHGMVELLHEQGLTQTSVAGMLNLTLRGYQRKLKRLQVGREEESDPSLQWRIYAYVREASATAHVRRQDILAKHGHIDETLVVGAITDLQSAGVIKRCEARGERWYEINVAPSEDDEGVEHLVHAYVANNQPVTLETMLTELKSMPRPDLLEMVDALVAARRINRQREGDEDILTTDAILIREGDEAGWKAAVYDHYSALIRALVTKLEIGSAPEFQGSVGGATYWFEVWPDHPLNEKARGFLTEIRSQAVALREEIDRYNQAHPDEIPEEAEEVRFYCGQYIRGAADAALHGENE